MKAPELKANANIYVLTWPEEQIEIRVDRLSDHNNALSGEILVKSTIPGLAQHLHQARLNLTSTQSRRGLAKHLQEECMELGPGEWNKAIEQTCVKVLVAYREGEPVINLDTWVPSKERLRYRIKPLLLEAQPNLFFGIGGVGKSLFATFLGVIVQEGYSIIPEDHRIPGLEVEPGSCLYLDYEASQEELFERVKALDVGLGVEHGSGLLYRFCHQSLPSEIEQIQRLVLEHRIQMVIIDSAGPACGGQPESAEATLQFFSALRSLRVTSLILAHRPKHGTESSPFGSAYWTNMARSVFELKKQQEAGEGVLHFGLFHRKVNTGRLQRPIAFKISLTNDEDDKLVRVKVKREEAADVQEFFEDMGVTQKILHILKRGGLTLDTLREELGIKLSTKEENTLKATLTHQKKQGILTNDGGKWGLVSNRVNEDS